MGYYISGYGGTVRTLNISELGISNGGPWKALLALHSLQSTLKSTYSQMVLEMEKTHYFGMISGFPSPFLGCPSIKWSLSTLLVTRMVQSGNGTYYGVKHFE